uniref:hypothetical protein n=1 Tax=Haemophilus parahaemolyticus TaxID=735 RepID=UPI0015F138BB|nr:hypothetical protein [Haemophilus parahaemolyticus]
MKYLRTKEVAQQMSKDYPPCLIGQILNQLALKRISQSRLRLEEAHFTFKMKLKTI